MAIIKADQVDMMVDMSINQMKKSGEIGDISHCLSVSEAKFISAFKKTMRYCVDKYGLVGAKEEALNNCFESQNKSDLGVSDSVFNQCSEKYSDNESESDENQDYSELSDEELMNKQAAESMELLNDLTNAVQTMSQGTENLVTLPVYSPSKIVAHYTDGMTYGADKRTLPIATFISMDSLEKVINFYKNSLPDFELHQEEGDMFTFMQEIPDNFRELSMDMENMPLYSIPHIAIYKIKLDGIEKTNIAITYLK